MSDYLFVYGTLCRNGGHQMRRHLARHADYLADGYFNGRLYRVAHYPGAVPSSRRADKVFGELYRLRNPAAAFARLDAYEGRDFVRRKKRVYLADGRQMQAWVYLFRSALTTYARIASGRFTRQG